MSIADMHQAQKQWEQARTYYEQALPLFMIERAPQGQANTLIDLGLARFELGEQEQGIRDIEQAVTLFRAIQDEEWARRAELRLLELKARLGQPQVDEELFEAFITVQSSQEMFQLALQHPHLMTDAWFALIEALIASQEDEQVKESFVQRLETLKQIKQTVEQGAVAMSKATNLVIEFALADWKARQQLLSDHADILLSEAIDRVIDTLLEANKDNGPRQTLENVRISLYRCRTWGVEAAYHLELSMRLGDGITIPTEYEATVMQVASLLSHREQDKTTQEQAVQLMEDLLTRLTDAVPPLFKGALLRDLAQTMQALPANHAARDLQRIEMHYRTALPLYQAAERPISVAFIQRSIGDILSDQGRYEEALEPLQVAAQGLQEQEQTKNDAAWSLSAYASALDYLGRAEEALGVYAQAMALLPDMPPLLRNRVEVLIHLRRLEEAEADLARATELDGNEDSSYLWFRRAQIAVARGDGLLADQMLNEVLKRSSSHDVQFLQAQSAWLRGDLSAAQEKLRHAFNHANAGEQASMGRELERLFAEHPDLPALATNDLL
jgi:tetratricopeptide (TPR) repeat protein